MENQHRKISGYRELSQDEIDLMNEIKAFGPQLQALCEKIENHIDKQHAHAYHVPADPEADRLDDADPIAWMGMGKQSMQEGLMFLTRSVAQPTFF